MPEQIRKEFTGHVIAKADLPDEVKAAAANDDSDLWAYATVEVADREQDIIRIDGMSLDNHRPESPIKIISQHLRKLDDGSFPVVGKVTKFQRTTYKSADGTAPALAFGMKFAPTKLGQEAKSLYDGGFLTDFSVGCMMKGTDAAPIKGGGRDIKKSSLFEISACLIGMNQNAHVMGRLKAAFGDDLNVSRIPQLGDPYPVAVEYLAAPLLEDKRAALNSVFLDNLVTKLASHLDKQHGEALVAIHNVESQFVKDGFSANRFENIEAAFKQLNSRLDDIESMIVAQPQAARQVDDHSSEQDDGIDWTPLESAVKQIITSLHPRK